MVSAMMIVRDTVWWTRPTPSRIAELMAESSFSELIARLQHNDREAIDLLIERYGRALRRTIERALFERQLIGRPGSVVDSDASDIYQTVLLAFLVRIRRSQESAGTSSGPFFETPAHLLAYLKVIAGNEIHRRQVRAHTAARARSLSR